MRGTTDDFGCIFNKDKSVYGGIIKAEGYSILILLLEKLMETSKAKTENVRGSSGAALHHINKKTHPHLGYTREVFLHME